MTNNLIEARAGEQIGLQTLKQKWGGVLYPGNEVEAVIPGVRVSELLLGFRPADRVAYAHEILDHEPEDLRGTFEGGITVPAVQRAFGELSLRARTGIFTPVIFDSEQTQKRYATVGFVSDPLTFSLSRESPNKEERLLDGVLQSAQASISRHWHLSGLRGAFNPRILDDGTVWRGVSEIFDPNSGRMLNAGEIDWIIENADKSTRKAYEVALLIAQGQFDLAQKIWRNIEIASKIINPRYGQREKLLIIADDESHVWIMSPNSWLGAEIQESSKVLKESAVTSSRYLKLGVVGGGTLITMATLIAACSPSYVPPAQVTETANNQEPLTRQTAEEELMIWKNKGEIRYGGSILTVEGNFNFYQTNGADTIIYPSNDGKTINNESERIMVATAKVTEVKPDNNRSLSERIFLARENGGNGKIETYILTPLSRNDTIALEFSEDLQVDSDTDVFKLAHLIDGEAEEVDYYIVIQNKGTMQEPGLFWLNGPKGHPIPLLELASNGKSQSNQDPKPTPTVPAGLISKLSKLFQPPPAQAAEQPTATSTQPPSPTPPATPTEQPTSTNTPKPTVTKLPTPTPEVWEGDLTEAEIQSYTDKLPCSQSDCIRESHFSDTYGHTWGVKVISTGKLKILDIIDSQTGTKAGTVTVNQLVTKDANGNGIIIYIPVQGSTVDNPDYNLFANSLSYVATEMGEPNINYNPIYEMMPMDFLARIYRQNAIFSYMFQIDEYNINYDSLKLFEIKFRDQNYQSQLQSFWQDSGVNTDNNNPLMLFPMSISILSK